MDKPLGVRLWVIGVLLSGVVVFFIREENIVAASCTLYSSLIIVKSLQILSYACDYFFGVCFLYFLFLTGWEFGLIPCMSLHHNDLATLARISLSPIISH